MNYLAHLKLSKPDSDSMVGNLMGDFRRFLNGAPLPEAVLAGIENHRRVDRFTDSHPLVADLRTCFSKKRRRFASLILDVSFDHFLVRHWQRFSDEDMGAFIERCYVNLEQGRGHMPPRMLFVVDRMVRNDWLGSYGHLPTIGTTIDQMSARIRFDNKLAGGIEEVEQNYDRLEQGFLAFYPLLEAHINL